MLTHSSTLPLTGSQVGERRGEASMHRLHSQARVHCHQIRQAHMVSGQGRSVLGLITIFIAAALADMVDDMTGCNIIADQFARGNNTTQAAAALVSAAYQKGSCDNISVLVVRLRRRQPGDVAAIPNGGVGGTGS
jgi:hypothetical protein